MPIRLTNIRLGLDADESALNGRAADRLGLSANAIAALRIVRRAIDSRHRRPTFVYSVDVALSNPDDEAGVAERTAATLVADPEQPRLELAAGAEPLRGRPVIIGSGPAGLFAGRLLAEHGFRPLIIERGRPVALRARDIDAFLLSGRLDPESNILFGLGGAGTWSDGKLAWTPSDPLAAWVLHELVRCGAPPRILADARPHIGTDLLRGVVTHLAERIQELGGEFRFGCRAEALVLSDGRATGVRCGAERIEAGAVLLAVGHSSRDTLRTLADQGVALEGRPFQIGVRIEHPQQMVDGSQYGRFSGHPRLPAADYTLRHRAHGGWRSVHSFCMCPGGIVLPAMNREGELCTNGMSRSARDGEFANAALVVPVGPKDFGSDALGGLQFQERIEQAAFKTTGSFAAAVQRADDFVSDRLGSPPERCSYPLGVAPVQFSHILPKAVYGSIIRALKMTFDRTIRGFASDRGTIIGPETRVSAPVRMVRGVRRRESISTPGLYPVGEGSGYAGGIISSAVDGLLTARTIIERFAAP